MPKEPKPRRYADDAPLSAGELKRLRPAGEAAPGIVAAYEAGTLRYRGQRGPQKAPTKQSATLRLDQDVLASLRATGAGWQTRVNDLLRAAIGVGA